MEQQIETEQINQVPADIQLFKQIAKIGDFEISPCKKEMNLEDKSSYRKLELTSAQKIQISGLLQHLPQATMTGMMAQAYTVRFPEGLPHTLMALKQGGYGSPLQGLTGKMVGSASFYPMVTQAALMGVFTTMSVVTGQYFLSQINNELRKIGTKIDAILEFLYEDKKAELLSEVAFAQYAYENYHSIIQHTEQRMATIGSLQQAKKVAIKDVEFYLNDFVKKLNAIKDEQTLKSKANRALNAKECLEFSLRLYIVSSLLEIYYSQNFDHGYIDFLEINIEGYIKKCSDRMLKAFGRLEGSLNKKDDNFMEKLLEVFQIKAEKLCYGKKVMDLLAFSEKIESGSWPISKQEIHDALCAPMQTTECILDVDGNVYVKNC